MNLSLVDPFVLAQDCPDVITGRLRECAAFAASARITHNFQAVDTPPPFASATAAICWHLDE
jgi:hypothetical protein